MVYFLAEISVRKLLNMYLRYILFKQDNFKKRHDYVEPGTTSPARIVATVNPSYRKTRSHRGQSRFSRHRHQTKDSPDSVLRSSPDPISFILYFWHYSLTYCQTDVLGNCRQCIETARIYLNCITRVVCHPSPYTWTVCQSSFGTILTLVAASRCCRW